MTQLTVLLLQLPVPDNPTTNVPLAAGYLKAYAGARGLLDRADIEILPRALADRAGDAAIARAVAERAPDVIGISLYTWNSERSLGLALRVRALLPGALVIVGGPEVQADNDWVLRHPAVDVAVVGEGEQTFAELLELLLARREAGLPPPAPAELAAVPGVVARGEGGGLLRGPERTPLGELGVVPSPYLLGYLEVAPEDMLMVEVSRWCPYSCSFCLYGRAMGPRLGGRYFGVGRLMDEIRWGLARGVTRVHFIEANLNLVPPFAALTRELAELNADGRLSVYAELRGEHLSEAAADALARAGLRVAEVGLQTANPAALRAARRRTDLAKWAAGTRRLYARGVEVLLDVILGLPEDDEDGVEETLAFIERERLGPYDIFTLQVLPGTAVRAEAAERGLAYQDRPPYYVLATDRLAFQDLRRLRSRLKLGAGLDPDAVEGCPTPRPDALDGRTHAPGAPLTRVDLRGPGDLPDVEALAAHVDVIADSSALAPGSPAGAWLRAAAQANPTTLLDLYLLGEAPAPGALAAWRESLPHTPGYLDRVAVYRRGRPGPALDRVSPRVWLVQPWESQLEPEAYRGAAEVVWAYELGDGEEPPLGAWVRAGGAGVWVRGPGRDALRGERALALWGVE